MGWEGLVRFYSLKSLVPALFTGRMLACVRQQKQNGVAFKAP